MYRPASMAMANNDFNHSFVLTFEKNFDEESFYEWMLRNWTHSFWYAAVYVVLIFTGKYYMHERPRFEIRAALATWSAVLAIFSIFGAIRTVPELVYVIRKYGWEYSMCSPSYFYGPISFWAYMFTVSKVYELGDTIFIILRKQQLIFLHWYHHVSVLIYVWYSYTDHTAPGRWFMVMNYTVHAFMYTYYAFRAMQFRIPKVINMVITSMQITQMTVGILVNIQTYKVKTRGDYCQQSMENVYYSIMMYISYFLLFAYFFFKTYFHKKKSVPSMEPINGKVANGGKCANGIKVSNGVTKKMQ